MQITMKEALQKEVKFKFEGETLEFDGCSLKREDDFNISYNARFMLQNLDKLVEVEDNYWDKDGRAIRELEAGCPYCALNENGGIIFGHWASSKSKESLKVDKYRFNLGNCFKDTKSAEAELTRLKQKQKERMAQNDK